MHIKSLSVHKQLGAAQITAALSQVQLLDNFIVVPIQPIQVQSNVSIKLQRNLHNK
jgi:hypothetical protein